MKTVVTAAALAAALGWPALSFAQSAQDETRAQVRAQLQQLADAGYRGRGDETTYPSNVQAAQERAGRREHAQREAIDTSGYGAPAGPRSESGAREPRGPGSLYFGA